MSFSPLHRSLSCPGKGACIIQWSYEPCHVGPPKMDVSLWRVLTKCDPLEEGMANHPVYLPWEPHELYKRTKRHDTERWASLVAQLVKNLPAMWETWVQSLGWEDTLEKERLPTLVFWPREFHGHSPWGHKESDMTEQLSHFTTWKAVEVTLYSHLWSFVLSVTHTANQKTFSSESSG